MESSNCYCDLTGKEIKYRQKTFIDFRCGIGVTATRHCHRKIVSAIQQPARLADWLMLPTCGTYANVIR